MNIRPDIAEFVADLEVFGKRKLNYPLEIGEILQIAIQTGLTGEFEELIFQAKFLARSQDVLTQPGHEAQRIERLMGEFHTGLAGSMDLLKSIVERSASDVAQKYSEKFFTLEPESINRLMMLYSDLSWVKNWQIDGKPLPYETKVPKIPAAQENINSQTTEVLGMGQRRPVQSFSRIQKSAVLAAILILLSLLLDPPVTILGWILLLWIMALLVYIIIQIIFIARNTNSQ